MPRYRCETPTSDAHCSRLLTIRLLNLRKQYLVFSIQNKISRILAIAMKAFIPRPLTLASLTHSTANCRRFRHFNLDRQSEKGYCAVIKKCKGMMEKRSKALPYCRFALWQKRVVPFWVGLVMGVSSFLTAHSRFRIRVKIYFAIQRFRNIHGSCCLFFYDCENFLLSPLYSYNSRTKLCRDDDCGHVLDFRTHCVDEIAY